MLNRDDAVPGIVIAVGLAFCVLVIGLVIAVPCSVWRHSMSGKALLAEAEYSRQIAVQEAHAKMESAKLLAQAEVERAQGVAKANEIIGRSLDGNEAYLRYLWIHNLEAGNHDVIYVPTEGQLPLLEAGRLKAAEPKSEAGS